jgi:hypothetical protein
MGAVGRLSGRPVVLAALSEYELQCSREDEARRNVRGLNLPWG